MRTVVYTDAAKRIYLAVEHAFASCRYNGY